MTTITTSRLPQILSLKVSCLTYTLGYNKFDFWWVQNWNLRHIYKICFLIFWAVFCAFGFKVFKKYLYDQQFFFWIKKDIKKSRISRWFWIRWKSCYLKKAQKKVINKTGLTNMSKSEKSAYVRHGFANTFFWCIFSKLFSTNSKSVWNSAFFVTHIEFFINEKFFALISTFCKLWLQMPRKRLKKTENLFNECVLEFY